MNDKRSSAALLAGVAWVVVGALLLLPVGVLQQLTGFFGTLLPWREAPSEACVGLLCPDKVVHLSVFALLCWVTARIHPTSRRAQLLSALAVTGYSWLLEGLQGWLGWRETDLLDALCNAAGATLGLLLGRWLGWGRR